MCVHYIFPSLVKQYKIEKKKKIQWFVEKTFSSGFTIKIIEIKKKWGISCYHNLLSVYRFAGFVRYWAVIWLFLSLNKSDVSQSTETAQVSTWKEENRSKNKYNLKLSTELKKKQKKWHNNILPFPFQQKREEEEINMSVSKKKKRENGIKNERWTLKCKCIVENVMKAGFYSQHELMPKMSHIQRDHST